MATQTRTTGLPYFFADQTSADGLRKELTDGPMAAARQDALGTALDLFTVLSALPAAFMDSQERELKRLERSGKERSPRIDALKASIEQARELRDTAELGQARVGRVLVAASSPDDLVHGFVSDASLSPMPGLTVRLTARTEKDGDGKSLSTTTDKDGYFSIGLGASRNRDSKPTAATPVKLSDRMAELLASVNAKADTAPAGATTTASADTGSQRLARIDVLDAKGGLLHRDPMPLVLNEGSAYREYVIVDGETAGRNDFRDFARADARGAAERATTPPTGKTGTAATGKAAEGGASKATAKHTKTATSPADATRAKTPPAAKAAAKSSRKPTK
jgi:hypothetical protein